MELSEDDGKVVGISDVDKTMRDIRDIISEQILPSTEGLCEINSLTYDDKIVVCVNVKKGDKLYYIRKEGRSATGCFYRDGISSTPMSEAEIERRIENTYSKKESMVEIVSKQKTFSFAIMKQYYSAKGFHINDETFESNLCLKTSDGEYNYLAELMSDTNRVSIKIAKFKGKDKSFLIEKTEYGYQCLLVAIDRVINRLEAENYAKSTIVGARRIDKRLMDMGSLREALINAMAHNDWFIIEPTVYIFSDRIEILSRGGLPKGETKEMFFKGISTPRNKELMRILSDLDYVEQTGYGVPKILQHYNQDIFEIEDNYINVTIPFDPEVMLAHTSLNDENHDEVDYEEAIILLIKNNPKITLPMIANNLNISTRVIERIIRNSAKIKRVGPDRGGYWEIEED